jgi:hypothetical protein
VPGFADGESIEKIFHDVVSRSWRLRRTRNHESDAKEGVMSQSPGPLLSVRSAFVLMLALVVAVVGGVLSYLSGHDLPAAVLVAGGAGGGAVLLFHTCSRARLPVSVARQVCPPTGSIMTLTCADILGWHHRAWLRVTSTPARWSQGGSRRGEVSLMNCADLRLCGIGPN